MPRFRNFCPPDCKVFVGDLDRGGTKREVEDAFRCYGPLRDVWVARNPPGLAFVEFEDARDARNAVRALNGKVLCGKKVRVEISNGTTTNIVRDRPPRGMKPDDRCFECGERGHYARECRHFGKRNHRSRSRGRSASRSQSRSASRSPSKSCSASRSPTRSRSKSGSHDRE